MYEHQRQSETVVYIFSFNDLLEFVCDGAAADLKGEQ